MCQNMHAKYSSGGDDVFIWIKSLPTIYLDSFSFPPLPPFSSFLSLFHLFSSFSFFFSPPFLSTHFCSWNWPLRHTRKSASLFFLPMVLLEKKKEILPSDMPIWIPFLTVADIQNSMCNSKEGLLWSLIFKMLLYSYSGFTVRETLN